MRLLNKRCPDYIGAGGLPDVSGQLLKSPKIGGLRGLIETISAISVKAIMFSCVRGEITNLGQGHFMLDPKFFESLAPQCQ